MKYVEYVQYSKIITVPDLCECIYIADKPDVGVEKSIEQHSLESNWCVEDHKVPALPGRNVSRTKMKSIERFH